MKDLKPIQISELVIGKTYYFSEHDDSRGKLKQIQSNGRIWFKPIKNIGYCVSRNNMIGFNFNELDDNVFYELIKKSKKDQKIEELEQLLAEVTKEKEYYKKTINEMKVQIDVLKKQLFT